LKNLAATEIAELENIGATTISAAQWGYLGAMDQGVATTDSPTFANEYIGEHIYHTGDVDTYVRFQTDQITLRAGGVDFLNLVEVGTDYLQLLNGKNFIGDSANANMTVGLTINQGANTNEIFAYKQSNVNHGCTDWVETDTFHCGKTKQGVATGGLQEFSISEEQHAWLRYAFYAGTGDTNKNGTAWAPIVIAPYRYSGVTYTQCTANENVFAIWTAPNGGASQAIFIIDEDGDVYHDGAIAAFQDEDDIELIRELEDILSDRIPKKEMKEKDVFKKHKVVNVNEAYDDVRKENRIDRFISTRKTNMLLFGAIRQLNKKIAKLEAKVN